MVPSSQVETYTSEESTLKKKLNNAYRVLAVVAALSSLTIIAVFTTPYMTLATLAYFSMVAGILNRKNKNLHSKLMGTAVTLDLTLVLVLEFTRNAIATAAAMTLEPLQQIHIGFSTLALLLYFPIVILGIMRFRGKATGPRSQKWHRSLGILAFIFRSLGFILMFSMLHHVQN